MNEWQPIETAPHTGVSVLLYRQWRSGFDYIVIGHYENGWLDSNYDKVKDATHWMLLPEPPK